MTETWLTVNFIPATQPVYAHSIDPRDNTTTRTEQIAGWMIDYKHIDGSPTPSRSRVVAGVWREGKVLPVHTTLTNFIGVYPEGVTPHPKVIEDAKKT